MYVLFVLPVASAATGNLIPCCFTVSAIFSTPLGWHTPMITRPWSLYLSISALVCGIELMHGPHHVAQKSMSTTLPLRLSRGIGSLLSQVPTVSAGAGLPSIFASAWRCSGVPSSQFGSTPAPFAPSPPAALACAPSAGGASSPAEAVFGVSSSSLSITSSTWFGVSPIARTFPSRSTTAYVGYHITLNAFCADKLLSRADG